MRASVNSRRHFASRHEFARDIAAQNQKLDLLDPRLLPDYSCWYIPQTFIHYLRAHFDFISTYHPCFPAGSFVAASHGNNRGSRQSPLWHQGARDYWA